jgi:hypothetical protein
MLASALPVHDAPPCLEIFGAAVLVAAGGIRVTGTYRQRDGVPQSSSDFGCNHHSVLPRERVLPRESHWPDRRRNERRGTLERVPSIKFWNGKPERFALAFRSSSDCTFADIKSREFSASSLVRVPMAAPSFRRRRCCGAHHRRTQAHDYGIGSASNIQPIGLSADAPESLAHANGR